MKLKVTVAGVVIAVALTSAAAFAVDITDEVLKRYDSGK